MIKNRVLVEGAFLIALSIILTRFFSIKITVYGVEGVRIGLGVMPIIIAGFRLGLYQGAKVGALADIVGYLLSPGGAYMPHFTLTSALNGVLPSLLIGKKEKISEVRLVLSVVISYFVISMILVPYFLFKLFGIPFEAIFLARLVSFGINIVLINSILLVLDRKISILSFRN
ncbi:MAG: folate family ECF transporter S component [Firmicutes bacterium HGW-Firmicutes-12]|nr:MAG: folate family ECF transporter S component [Firmicutes bacterium HGW-Firmicutes-12]